MIQRNFIVSFIPSILSRSTSTPNSTTVAPIAHQKVVYEIVIRSSSVAVSLYPIYRLIEFSYVRMSVAQHHAQRFPSAEFL